MAVTITKPAQNLREELAALRAKVSAGLAQEVFYFAGNAVLTAFVMPRGWKPKFVYVNGLLKRIGTGEDYSVSYDGFLYTVTFFVAPAAVDIDVICVREG